MRRARKLIITQESRYVERNNTFGQKQHIEQHIPDNEELVSILKTSSVTQKTKNNIILLHRQFGRDRIFSRSDVIEVIGITARPDTTLLNRMYELGLTEQIAGAGKGKYRFIV